MNIDYRNNIDESLNLKNLSICKNLITQNKIVILGKGLQGEVFKAKSPECGSVVLKRKIVKEENKKWKDNESWLKEELYGEYRIMQLTNRMIDKFICPNFIKAYDFDRKMGILIMEYADSDTKFLFKNEYYDTEVYKSYICQILLSIYIFNNYTMLFHRDVKPDNILCKKIDKDIVFHYKIGKLDFYIPTFGYLFMLADFGIVNFKLGDRLPDIQNLNYKVAFNYISNLSEQYPMNINQHELDDLIKMIGNSKIKIKRGDVIKNTLNLINFCKNIKDKKINNYVFEIYNILNYSEDILNILNRFYGDFTKNNYKDKIIIDFVLDL